MLSTLANKKERPLLFAGAMVRAVLDGRKSNTRRVCKIPIEIPRGYPGASRDRLEYLDRVFDKCPHGQPRDRIWVKETYSVISRDDSNEGEKIIYRADDWNDVAKWKPSIFMPRKYSRILLEIESIGVERVNDISQEDAIAEGIEPIDIGYRLWTDYLNNGGDRPGSCYPGFKNPVDSFKSLWDSINAKKCPWKANVWVWVIRFKVLEIR